MHTKLPARPNLDHLRTQAKHLLADLRDGKVAAANIFIEHLRAARGMTPDRVRRAGLRLADAQSAIARKSGFENWPSLARHVEHLRGLEGHWTFARVEVDAAAMPVAMISNSRMLIDGDRFRMESPEAIYEGIFAIDVEADPHRIDIEFVEGPEAGKWSYGIYTLDGDDLTICLGVTGARRPERFATSPGSGHALERLRRASDTCDPQIFRPNLNVAASSEARDGKGRLTTFFPPLQNPFEKIRRRRVRRLEAPASRPVA